MSGLFFRDTLPRDYTDWVNSDYELYDALAARLIAQGILVEPDSREPLFVSAAHDEACLDETLDKFGVALGLALEDRAGQD